MAKRNCHPMAIEGLYAIGQTSTYSLTGQLGARLMIEKWGYPPIDVGPLSKSRRFFCIIVIAQ
jgi:hypothetical protein